MKKSSTGKTGSRTKTTSSTKPAAKSKSTSAKRTTSAKGTSGRGTGKRELIDTKSDKRYVRRDGAGQFKEVDDLSRSLSADRRTAAKTKVKPGYGDRGDR